MISITINWADTVYSFFYTHIRGVLRPNVSHSSAVSGVLSSV